MIPKDLRYLETHEWARREGQTDIVTVGISDFAIEQLGDIVFLELPQIGAKVQKASTLGTIESVKAASELYAPISGEIVEVNDKLPDDFELFKNDNYSQAWLVKIKASDMTEFDSLMDAAAYERTLEGQ